MIATDIFPILAFCFGFIITRCLSSRPRSNETGDRSEGAAGIRLGSSSKDDGIDIELGSPCNAQCNGLARRAPQSTKEVGEKDRAQGREVRLAAALDRIPKKQKRKKRSHGNAPLRGPLVPPAMTWGV
eukprot:scaffold9508_cov178-Skeletonema_dohrnii-CCMP3373.AAC.3